jgi:hypothetical protein
MLPTLEVFAQSLDLLLATNGKQPFSD